MSPKPARQIPSNSLLAAARRTRRARLLHNPDQFQARYRAKDLQRARTMPGDVQPAMSRPRNGHGGRCLSRSHPRRGANVEVNVRLRADDEAVGASTRDSYLRDREDHPSDRHVVPEARWNITTTMSGDGHSTHFIRKESSIERMCPRTSRIASGSSDTRAFRSMCSQPGHTGRSFIANRRSDSLERPPLGSPGTAGSPLVPRVPTTTRLPQASPLDNFLRTPASRCRPR